MIRKVFGTFLSTWAILWFSVGCVHVAKYEYSRPTALNQEWKPEGKNGFASGGVTLVLLPLNFRVTGFAGPILPVFPSSQKYDKSPFGLLVVMYLKENSLTIDPAKVVIEVERDVRVKPTRLIGPSPIQDNCRQESDPRQGKQIQGEISTSENSCFLITFDMIPPDVKETFLVTIDGLRVGNNLLPPLVVQYTEFESKWLWGFGTKETLKIE